MANGKSLFDNQIQDYIDEIEILEFSASGGGAKSSTSSRPFQVKDPGIRLYFLRYGLFDRNSKTDDTTNVNAPAKPEERTVRVYDENAQIYSIKKENEGLEDETYPCLQLDEVEVIALKDLPDLQNFYIGRTKVEPGYIYLMNDEDPNEYYELEIDEYGMFAHIIWEYNKDENGEYKDIRHSEDEKLKYKLVKPGKKLWIAYSPVQWSRKYHNELNTNAEKRKERMVLIDCSGIKKGKEDKHEHAIPYNQVKAVFDKDDPYIGILKNVLENITGDESQQDQEGGNELYEDMFVALNDPIGCANDVASILIDEHQKHEAICESIQTGESDKIIYKRLKKFKRKTTSQTKYEKQVQGLFSSTLTLYHFIYNDEEMEDEYAHTTDKNKLLKILAVKERREQRSKISKYRNDFGELLSCDYYKKYFCDFIDGGIQELFEGKCIIPAHLALLAVHPHDKDRHLDLAKLYEGKNDIWNSFFDETLRPSNNYYKVLNKEIDTSLLKQSVIAAKLGFKLSRRLVKSFKKSLDAYAKHAVRSTNFEVFLGYMKAFKYKGETVIQIRTNQANAVKDGFLLDIQKMVKEEELVRNNKGRIGKKLLRIKTNMSVEEAKRFAANKKIKLSFKGIGNKSATFIKNVLESSRFRAFLLGLEVVNAAVKLEKTFSNGSIKNNVSTMGAVAHVISTGNAYYETRLLQKGIDAGDDVVKRVKGVSKVSGFIGSGVSVVMCIWDSVESFRARDCDAGLVWGLTALVSGVLLADGIVAFSSGAAAGFLGFWPIIILSALFFGGVFLAIYLADTPLEIFLKNNALNSDKTLSGDSDRPYKYIEKIYRERDRLVSNKFDKWCNFQMAAEDLYDLLISYRVVRENLEFYSDLDDEQAKKEKGLMDHVRDAFQISAGVKYKSIKKLRIEVKLRKFIYNTSELHYSLILLPEGLRNPSNYYYLTNEKVSIIDPDYTDTLRIIYKLPEQIFKELSLSSEFMFLSKTIINEKLNEYWPSQRKNNRYHAYKFSAVEFIDPTTSPKYMEDIRTIYGMNVRIDTEDKLLMESTWI